jgi:DNA-binding transcriptional MocR family regulator
MIRSIGTGSLVRQLGLWRGQGGGSAYRQLADGVRLLILDGRLPIGVRIPGERELAAALDVSRTTVTAAFGQLRDEGYLDSRRGSGSRTSLPDRGAARPQAETGEVEPGIVDLGVAALPATDTVHHAYRSALASLPRHLPGHGYERIGLNELRAAIADRYTRRGCATSPEQIMVTHGALHGFALLLRLFAEPGDRIVVDHPTYPHAIDAIQQASCRAVPVGLPEFGWDADAIDAAFRQTAPRLAYLQPDFHNPTGRCMDAATRGRIAAAAARTQTIVVADETMADLWLDEAPPLSLAAHDKSGQVVTLGSMGKSFWGGLRLGWVRAEPRMIEGLARVRAALDLGTPVLEQLAATVLLTDDGGDLEARRSILRLQRSRLLSLIGTHLPDWKVAPPPGGLSIWAELPFAASTALAATSEMHGVRIGAGPRFGVDGSFERFLRVPYALPDDMLRVGVERLSRAWNAIGPGSRTIGQPGHQPSPAQVY